MKVKVSTEDEAIGQRLRERRKLLGFTLSQLAHLLLISVQQLNKYENGGTRIPITHLAKICKILNVSADHLIHGGPTALAQAYKNSKEDSVVLSSSAFKIHDSLRKKSAYQEQLNTAFRAAELVNQPETKNLVKGYISIPDPRIRSALLELVMSITKYINKRTA